VKASGLLMFAWAVLVVGASAEQDETGLARHLLSGAGIRRGICSIPRCGNGELAISVAESSGFLVHAQDHRPSCVAAAREAANRKGLLGHRVIVEKGTLLRLPYADNTVDLILIVDLADGALGEVSVSEMLRVLRPLGKAIVGRSAEQTDNLAPERLEQWLSGEGVQEPSVWQDPYGVWAEVVKPEPVGVDDWRHWAHEPDNNPYSNDTAITAPYMTQWLGKPYYVAMPCVTTAAGGRLFVATGHIAHHDREVPTLSLLCARNGYNGMVLWQRKLPDGYLVHRSAFIATDETFYLMDGNGCLLLDPETGKERGRVCIPGVEGEWKWMALKDGVLFVLAGKEGPPAEATLVKSGSDHWSWGRLSPGYYAKPRVPWGFGTTIAAYDLDGQRALWKHDEPAPVDSRAVGISNGRVFFYAPESRIGCLDARSGELLWDNTDGEVLKLIEEPGRGLASTPGFRTTCILLCTPKAIYFEAQTRMNVVAVSAENGSLLWQRKRNRNDSNLVFADGQLFGGMGRHGNTVVLDPISGETVEDLPFRKVNCVRLTGCHDSFFCRGEGLGRYDRNQHRYFVDGSARPGCNDGAIPANGLLYVGPWLCDCNLSLIGTVTLCSAGDFRFDYVATEEERLEVGEGDILSVVACDADEYDWPTYRANNRRTAGSKATVPSAAAKLWEYRPRVPYRPSPLSAVGGLAFLGGDDGKVRCIDGRTGELRWGFVTAGPVRLPPSIWQGRAFVGSADGYIYALEAATGRLLWRFRAAPVQRRIMVYGALCSTWPVNSGVLVEDGVAYAAAGIVDHDGTYVYALDAMSGAIKWQNNSSGHLNEAARKGVSVQGDLTVARGKLWMAGGNQVCPASYDLQSGRLEVGYMPSGGPRSQRGCEVAVFKDRYILSGGRLLYSGDSKVVSSGYFGFLQLDEEGKPLPPEVHPVQRSSIPPAWNENTFVYLTARYGQLVCWDTEMMDALLELRKKEKELVQSKLDWRRRGRATQALEQYVRLTGKWGPQNRDTLAVVVAANAVVAACELPARGDQDPRWVLTALASEDGRTMWQQQLPAEPLLNGLIVDRNGRVLVALKDGRVVCFGPRK